MKKDLKFTKQFKDQYEVYIVNLDYMLDGKTKNRICFSFSLIWS